METEATLSSVWALASVTLAAFGCAPAESTSQSPITIETLLESTSRGTEHRGELIQVASPQRPCSRSRLLPTRS